MYPVREQAKGQKSKSQAETGQAEMKAQMLI